MESLVTKYRELLHLVKTDFVRRLANKHHVTYPKSGDFSIDDKYLFEVGGKNKTVNQIAGSKNAYLALDDLEYGHAQKIPLWLFGFLY